MIVVVILNKIKFIMAIKILYFMIKRMQIFVIFLPEIQNDF
jgi:hypothetical protein